MTIDKFPVALFSSTMGLGGLGLGWRDAQTTLGVPALIGEAMIAATIVLFIALSVCLAIKISRLGSAFVAETKQPAAMNYLTAPSISLLLIAAGIEPYYPALALPLWLFAAIANISIAIYVTLYCWFPQRITSHLITPSYFMPLVANFVIPTTGGAFDFDTLEWMIMGASTFFFVTLTPVILYRLLVEEPLADTMQPTMFVFIAPPSLCFSGIVMLNDGLMNSAATFTFGIVALITVMTLIYSGRSLFKPFCMSFWAATFPLAALAKACLLLHAFYQTPASGTIAWVALALATFVFGLVFLKATGSLFKGALSKGALFYR